MKREEIGTDYVYWYGEIIVKCHITMPYVCIFTYKSNSQSRRNSEKVNLLFISIVKVFKAIKAGTCTHRSKVAFLH